MSSMRRSITRNLSPRYRPSIRKGGTKRRLKRAYKKRSEMITVKRDWRCGCGREVKRHDHAWRIHGYTVCFYCYWSKAPIIYSMKGWGEVPGRVKV